MKLNTETWGQMMARVCAARHNYWRSDHARELRAERTAHPFGSPARRLTVGHNLYRAALRRRTYFA